MILNVAGLYCKAVQATDMRQTRCPPHICTARTYEALHVLNCVSPSSRASRRCGPIGCCARVAQYLG